MTTRLPCTGFYDYTGQDELAQLALDSSADKVLDAINKMRKKALEYAEKKASDERMRRTLLALEGKGYRVDWEEEGGE